MENIVESRRGLFFWLTLQTCKGTGMTRFSRKANENRYSSRTVDTKEELTEFPRGWKQMLRNSHGVEKVVSRESPGYVAQEIYVVLWLCKIPKMMQICLTCGPPKSEKAFSLSPTDSAPGALPLDPAGGSVPRPPYRFVLHALAMCPGLPPPPQLKIPGAATGSCVPDHVPFSENFKGSCPDCPRKHSCQIWSPYLYLKSVL